MTNDHEISEQAVSTLQQHFGDRCILPGDSEYQDEIQLWNGAIDRYPAVVVGCQHTDDVVNALEVATNNDIPFSVKAGGHMTTGHALVEDGIVLDLSPLNRVELRDETITVGGGATWDAVNEVALEHGLLPPGIPETVGVGGFTLGGGMGVTGRLNGLACDNLVSAEVVTAAGDVVTASATENEDLYWALRGGGGNLGVVTSFAFECIKETRECLVANVLYPIEEASEYLTYFGEVAPELPAETFPTAALLTIPELPDLPEELHGELAVAGYVMCVGTDDSFKKALEEFADFGDPHVAAVYPADYTELYLPFQVPTGQRHHWESFYFKELDMTFADALVEEALPMPTPQTSIALYGLGGAINEVDPTATAYPHRDAPFALHLTTHWLDETDDDRCIEWTRAVHQALREHGTGGEYVNNQTDTDEDRVRAAYGVNYDRIAEVKSRWDPADWFRSTQHVEPKS